MIEENIAASPPETKFQDLTSFTPADVRAALARDDTDELALMAITAAIISPDVLPAREICLRLCLSPHPRVRGNALVSLGHLARRFRMLDEDQVKPLIEAALIDPDKDIRDLAKSAADEIHQFLHWTMRGHRYG